MGRADRKAPRWQFFSALLTRAGSALSVTLQNRFLPFSLYSSTAYSFIKLKPQHTQPEAVIRTIFQSLKVPPNTAAGEDKPHRRRQMETVNTWEASHVRSWTSAALGIYESNPIPHPSSRLPNTSLSHHDTSRSSGAERCVGSGSLTQPVKGLDGNRSSMTTGAPVEIRRHRLAQHQAGAGRA